MATYEQRYKQLNPEQRTAVDTIMGPVLVVAGPGSGKTELLSLRVANILRETDYIPSNILCLTFTDAASINMRERLAGLIGSEAHKVHIHTFHSFGTDIISRYREYFFEGAPFEPADELVSIEIANGLMEALPFGHPFKKQHPRSGYIFTRPLLGRISDLKKGGVTPAMLRDVIESNKDFLTAATPIFQQFFGSRISKSHLEQIPSLLTTLQTISGPEQTFGFASYKELLMGELLSIHSNADSTKPLTAFKKRFFKKNEKKEDVFSDMASIEKMESLASLYEEYQRALHERGYYDFDDMLLETRRMLQEHEDVRFDLLEQYQFILVDEFQDTNGIQMSLLELLLEEDNPSPNILCVGDDDQAIYKFQGANIQNFLSFHKHFEKVTTVLLTKNYRSTQHILDYARRVIVQAEERIENEQPELSKILSGENISLDAGIIQEHGEATALHEYYWVADQMKALHHQGLSYDDMAVISRNHRQLEEISQVLQSSHIPVHYERKQNVLDHPLIQELIHMLYLVHDLTTLDSGHGSELLSTVLSYPFLEVPAVQLWTIARETYSSRTHWMDHLLASEDEHLKHIGAFFLDLAKEAKAGLPLERLIDRLLGTATDTADEDGLADQIEQAEEPGWTSPFKAYYFDRQWDKARPEYIKLLSHLKSFITSLRNYRKKEVLYLDDLITFMNVHETYNLPVNDFQIYEDHESSVSLLTGHKSKGLEFRAVFVIGCMDDVWVPRARGEALSLPKNLPLMAASDTIDDKIRLFYVALTRAKEYLYMSYHRTSTNGKEKLPLRFLQQETTAPTEEVATPAAPHDSHVLERWYSPKAAPFTKQEEQYLKDLLQDYHLSVTHLNNFLDVSFAGPRTFLQMNLLRFPMAMNKHAAFGSAMHKAIQRFYGAWKREGTLPDKDHLTTFFRESLESMRLPKADLDDLLPYGTEKLSVYYDQRKNQFSPDDLIEQNFRNEGVVIGKAKLTGMIDKMRVDKDSRKIVVTDFKTGSAAPRWNHSLKLWKYRQQLVFYKLLVEGSSSFRNYEVDEGALEFLEDLKGESIILSSPLTKKDAQQLEDLIMVVYDKIMNLDFPDTSHYPEDIYGVKAFIGDLLAGKI